MRPSRPRLVLLTLVLAACGGARDEGSPARAADSARPTTAPAPTSATAQVSAPAAPPPAQRVDSEGPPGGASAAIGSARDDALCAGVAAAARSALQIAFARDSGSTFPWPGGGRDDPPWQGCRIRGTGTVRPYSDVAAMPEQKLRVAMRRSGWVEDLAFEASGPEGSAFALRRGQVLCHYDVFFPDTPGDDDSPIDSTAPSDSNAPPLRYIVQILCTTNAPRRGD